MIGSGIPRPGRVGPGLVRCGGGGSRAGWCGFGSVTGSWVGAVSSIYWEKPDGSWGEDSATRAQCAGLERSAVWDAEHVEDRLRDRRAGRLNKWAESLALKD